jgi:hypothetical protein
MTGSTEPATSASIHDCMVPSWDDDLNTLVMEGN